jgi:hypothetical protein
MEELVKLVAEKTGLSEDVSRQAVEVVLGFLKQRLPDPIAGRLDDLLAGAESGIDLGDLAAGLGGLLGNK